VRQERLKRQVELGIMPPGTELAERMWFVPDPIVLAPASRAILARRWSCTPAWSRTWTSTSAADRPPEEDREYDNTIFIVFGDNGAEGADLFKMIAGSPGTRDFLYAAIKWSQTHPTPGATRARTSATARCGRRCR